VATGPTGRPSPESASAARPAAGLERPAPTPVWDRSAARAPAGASPERDTAAIDDRPTGVATVGRAMTPVVNVEHSSIRLSGATAARTTETGSRTPSALNQNQPGRGRRAAAVPEFVEAGNRTDFLPGGRPERPPLTDPNWTEAEEAWFAAQLAAAPSIGPRTRKRLIYLLGHLVPPSNRDVRLDEMRPTG
jgi:hypothetical protein